MQRIIQNSIVKRLILSLLFLVPFAAAAQQTANELESVVGGRVSVGADWKIAKGLHLGAETELRTADSFSGIRRVQAGVSLSYKISPWLKASAGYLLIENSKDGEWVPRHRVYADLTSTLNAGDWRFALRERVLLTHRDDGNFYQVTPNLFQLKTRLKISYRGFRRVTPYGILEARTVLNDPACSATWNGTAYSDYTFKGYTDTYFNRYRGGLGLEWKLDKKNSIDFYGLLDYCYDKNIDTNVKGTRLKSLTYDQTLRGIIGVGYTFSF